MSSIYCENSTGLYSETPDTNGDNALRLNETSSLQVLCLEVERQLNRHYLRLLDFFRSAFADSDDYPLTPEQAVMLFCAGNEMRNIALLCRTLEPVTGQTLILLAGLHVQGFVTSGANNLASRITNDISGHDEDADLSLLQLTSRGQAITIALHDLYHHEMARYSAVPMPDAARLAALHRSLLRLQRHHGILPVQHSQQKA